MNIWKRMTMKEDPSTYEIKDAHLARTLRVHDFLGLGSERLYLLRLHYQVKLLLSILDQQL